MPRIRRAANIKVILALVCGAQFMVTLDLVVVNVALPSMQNDLGLGLPDLQWVVVAYGLTFGGFLLLGGRAADLYGRRRVLLGGLTMFTLGSLGAGLAGSLTPLLISRAGQGSGAAMAAPAALSILTSTFEEGIARNKALGIFGGVAGSAACGGLVLGGVLTGGPGWRWIFLINVPIGIALVALVFAAVPRGKPASHGSIDLPGAVTVTVGLLAIVFAINRSADYGWASPITLGVLAGGATVLGSFAVIERKTPRPLIPLSMFRSRTLTTANVVAALVMGSFFGTAFQTTLFLQRVLGYTPLITGLANVIGAASSVVVAAAFAARMIGQLGAGWTLVIGQGFAVAGLLYLSRAPVDAVYWTNIFPAFLAAGIGIGLSGVAVQVAAFIGLRDRATGLVGGLVSTAQEIGAAVGLAIVATAAAAHSAGRPGAGGQPASVDALTAGFHRGVLVAAGFSLVAALAAGVGLRRTESSGRNLPGGPASPAAARPGPAPEMLASNHGMEALDD